MNRPAFSIPALPVGTSALHGAGVCTATRSRIAPASRARVSMAFTSIGGVLTDAPVSMPTDADSAVRAVYKFVLGNAYLMEEEAEELKYAESQFRMTKNVADFVRSIAKSNGYKSRFFEPVSAFRSVELLFKHILGRGPRSLAEYGAVMRVLQGSGFDAAVDNMVDSEEYQETFGESIVPYNIYRGMYPTNEEFNRARALEGPPSSSDKARASVLQYAVCSGDSPSWLSISKALPAGTERGTGFTIGGHWTSSVRNKKAPVKVGTKVPGGVVFY